MVQLLANVLVRQHSVAVNGALSPKALDSRFSSTSLPGSEVQEVRLEIENRGKQVRLSVGRDGRHAETNSLLFSRYLDKIGLG